MTVHSLKLHKPVAILFAATIVALALILGGLNAGPAEAKVKQPSCGKIKKKSQKKACKANALVYNQVKNATYVGTRTDGVEIDTIYCANGKAQDGYGTDFPSEVYKGGWKVVGAKVKSPKKFSGIIEVKIKGGTFVQGIIRNGSSWKIGYEFGGKINEAGPVIRTKASKECSKL